MLWIVLLLIVAPILELYVAIQVAQVIGGWETIGLLLLMGVVGGWLLKQQGLAALARISAAVAENRAPAKEMVDGLLILVAGALMLAPGFVGDVIALVLLLPPSRALVRAPITSRLRAGRWGSLMNAGGGTAGGGRFVGTFRATGFDTTTFDTTARDTTAGDTDQGDRSIEP